MYLTYSDLNDSWNSWSQCSVADEDIFYQSVCNKRGCINKKMWFEILPSAGIIFAAFSVPGIGMYYINKFFLGNPYRRDLRWMYDRSAYLRDRRLTNNPYRTNGLEVIPDS
ncbi:NADH dehydrogenase (ubiquinone) MWFE subunit [Carabus blaptoides fortunei]